MTTRITALALCAVLALMTIPGHAQLPVPAESLAWMEGTWEASYRDAEDVPVRGTIEITARPDNAGVTQWSAEARFNHPRTNELLIVRGRLTGGAAAISSRMFEFVGTVTPPGAEIDAPRELPATGRLSVQLGSASASVEIAGRTVQETRALTVTLKPDAARNRLEGEWRYTNAAPQGVASQRSGERGPEIWERRRPVIVHTQEVDDQTSEVIAGSGYAAYQYPFGPDAPRVPQRERTLLVMGRHLPILLGDAAAFESADKTVEYSVITGNPPRTPELRTVYGPLISKGLSKVVAGQDSAARDALYGLDLLLVRVRLLQGVAPGRKSFTLNGAQSTWTLQFGGNVGRVQFVRDFGRDTEKTTILYLPESFRLEVHTDVQLPVEQFEVRLARNGAEIKRPAPLIARRVPGAPKVYRTAPLNLHPEPAAGAAPLATDPNAVYVKLYDSLTVAVGSPTDVVDIQPAYTNAQVFRTPGEVRGLFKDALRKAAACSGQQVQDWSEVPAETADRITSTVIVKFDKATTPAQMVQRWTGPVPSMVTGYVWNPTVSATDVLMGHLAAMILMRDVFGEMLRTHALDMAEIKTPAHRRGFKKLIESRISDRRFPLANVDITAPDGGRLTLGAVYQRDFVRTRYALTEAQLETWIDRAFEEGIKNYRASVDRAVARARGTGDCDVMALLELTGTGFDTAVIPELLPRLMELRTSGQPPRMTWVPDQQARDFVRGVGDIAARVRMQRAAANADTQIILGIGVALAALPAASIGGLAGLALSIGLEAADVAINIGTQLGELNASSREMDFALGGSGVLGTDRFLAAEANQKELGAALAFIGLAAGGGAMGTMAALAEVPSAMAARTFRKYVDQVEREGLAGFARLAPKEQLEFQRYLVESAGARASVGPANLAKLSAQELRATRVLDALAADPAVRAARERITAPAPAPVPAPAPAVPSTPRTTVPDDIRTAPVPSERTRGLSDALTALPSPRGPPISPERAALEERLTRLRDLAIRAEKEQISRDAVKAAAKELEGTTIELPGTRATGAPQRVELGEWLGGGSYGQVFKVKGRDDLVAKVFVNPNEGVQAAIDGQIAGAARLRTLPPDARVATKEILSVAGDPPAFVMARLQGADDARRLAGADAAAAERVPAGVEYQVSGQRILTDGESRAVLDLYRKLARNGVAWEDGALRNIYFFRNRNNAIEAGILDSDRIARADDVGPVFTEVRQQLTYGPAVSGSPSMADVPLAAREVALKDPDFFAEKMLERHGFLDYEPGKGWAARRIKPELAQEYFPNLPKPFAERVPRAAASAPTPATALTGTAIVDEALNLEGRAIRLPRAAAGTAPGTITLGPRVGSVGHFGVVYEIQGQPGRLIKIIHNDAEQSVARQAAGFDLIRNDPLIPAPRVLSHHQGGPGDASYLIVEDLRQGAWAGRNVTFGASQPLNEAQRAAAADLYRAIAARGYIWPDGHRGNLFFFTEASGATRAGILDHDMIFRASDYAKQSASVQERVYGALMGVKQLQHMHAVEAGTADAATVADVMAGMYRKKFDRTLAPAGLPPPSRAPPAPPAPPPPPRPTVSRPPTPSGSPAVDDFAARLQRGEKPTAADIMALQRNTADMRSLKNAPADVKKTFNALERELVYAPHDEAVIDFVKQNVPGMLDKDIRVHDFRTPGADEALSINTDRDYRVLFRKPGTGDWIEVPRHHWEDHSHDVFAKLTGYDPVAGRALLPAADRPRWDRMTDLERKRRWAELHQQLPTDRWHPEASLDFSDQSRTASGALVMTEANIIKVRAGQAELIDPRRLGMMYNEKADVYLRQSNPLEAMAQLNKGTALLEEVRAAYTARRIPVGTLSERFTEAAKAIRSLAPFDRSITPARIAQVDARLRSLGFRGIADFKDALDSQFHALQAVAR